MKHQKNKLEVHFQTSRISVDDDGAPAAGRLARQKYAQQDWAENESRRAVRELGQSD